MVAVLTEDNLEKTSASRVSKRFSSSRLETLPSHVGESRKATKGRASFNSKASAFETPRTERGDYFTDGFTRPFLRKPNGVLDYR